MPDFELPQGTSKVRTKSNSTPNTLNRQGSAPTQAPAQPVADPALLKDKTDEEVLKADGAPQKPQYPKDELLRIFDEIIFSGEYTEDIVIGGKLPVRFRTRTAEEINEIQNVLDGSGYNLISTVENMRSILNLQYGLVSYRGANLGIQKVEERKNFISKLSGPVVGMLLVALGKFDHKVAEACREGEENF